MTFILIIGLVGMLACIEAGLLAAVWIWVVED